MVTLADRLGLTRRPRLIKGPALVVRSSRATETPPMRGPVAAYIQTSPATKWLEGVEAGPGRFGTSLGTAAVGLDMRWQSRPDHVSRYMSLDNLGSAVW